MDQMRRLVAVRTIRGGNSLVCDRAMNLLASHQRPSKHKTMELSLQPLGVNSRVSQRPFVEGDRVVSYLVRSVTNEIERHDVLVIEDVDYRPAGFVFCRWAQLYKPRKAEENSERTLKLTAENLFLTLANPANEPNPANTPLLQFLAVMLERKRLLRPRGVTPDGERNLFEHVKTHQMYEIQAGELTPEFFVQIQEQLGLLVGSPKKAPAVPAAEPVTPPPATPAQQSQP